MEQTKIQGSVCHAHLAGFPVPPGSCCGIHGARIFIYVRAAGAIDAGFVVRG